MRLIGRLTGPWRSRPVAPARRAPRRRRRRRPAAACLARGLTHCWAWALRVSRLSAVTCCYGLVARRTEHDESAIRLGALTEGWDAGAPHPSVLSCSEELVRLCGARPSSGAEHPEMSTSDTKAQNGTEPARRNRMISTFCFTGRRHRGSFVSDLDTKPLNTQEDQPESPWMKPSAITADDPMASRPTRRTHTPGSTSPSCSPS